MWGWRRFGAVLPRDVGGHDQRRHLTGRAGSGGDRLNSVAGELLSAARRPYPRRNVARDRLDIGLQRRVVLSVVRGVIAHYVEQRDPRPARVVEVCDPVAEPRPKVQEGRRGRVRHPCVPIRGPGRDALEQREDRPHFRHRIQRGDEVDLRRARVREARLDACADEGADQCVGAVGHRCAASISSPPAERQSDCSCSRHSRLAKRRQRSARDTRISARAERRSVLPASFSRAGNRKQWGSSSLATHRHRRIGTLGRLRP